MNIDITYNIHDNSTGTKASLRNKEYFVEAFSPAPQLKVQFQDGSNEERSEEVQAFYSRRTMQSRSNFML